MLNWILILDFGLYLLPFLFGTFLWLCNLGPNKTSPASLNYYNQPELTQNESVIIKEQKIQTLLN